MAKALTVRIHPGQALEIGMTPLTLTAEGKQDRVFRNFPPELSIFKWYGDVFDLPLGAVALASSQLTPSAIIEKASRHLPQLHA